MFTPKNLTPSVFFASIFKWIQIKAPDLHNHLFQRLFDEFYRWEPLSQIQSTVLSC